MNSQGSIGNKLSVKDTLRSGVVLSGTAKVRHCSLLLGDVEKIKKVKCVADS